MVCLPYYRTGDNNKHDFHKFDLVDTFTHLLKVEIDYGSSLVDMGTTAFMSVPLQYHNANSLLSF